MRAMVISEFNKPWELRELTDPRPAPGQVLIRVHASGMCGTDLHVHHGMFPLKPPIVAGHGLPSTFAKIAPRNAPQ